MATTTTSVSDICLQAQAAARALAVRPGDGLTKDAALHAIADALPRAPEILDANARDMEAGGSTASTRALLDRLLADAAASRRSPARCATSRRCPTRSAR